MVYLIRKTIKPFRKALQNRLGLKPVGFCRGLEYLWDHVQSEYWCMVVGDKREFSLADNTGLL